MFIYNYTVLNQEQYSLMTIVVSNSNDRYNQASNWTRLMTVTKRQNVPVVCTIWPLVVLVVGFILVGFIVVEQFLTPSAGCPGQPILYFLLHRSFTNHFWSGSKYSLSGATDISLLPVNFSKAYGHGLLLPISSIAL